MKFNFNEVIENRQRYPRFFGNNDTLIDAILEGKYKSEFAMLTLGTLHKKSNQLLSNRYIDIIIQIPSPFIGTGVDFCIVHFSDQKPKKVLTGIFRGNVCEKEYKKRLYDANLSLMIIGKYTEDFESLINAVNMFLENKTIKREDLNVVTFDIFNKEKLNPLYYTKQAIKIRKELQDSDYKLLNEFAEIVTNQEEKNIFAKYIDSTNMTYPLVYNKLKETEIKKAIKVKYGDIICLLVGKQPKFYLYNEKYNDIYIKAGNYCLLRCKESKYRSYLVNYLKDEKARFYFSSTVRGSYIPHLTKSDLMNLKIIIPDSQMLKIADETQSYLMDRKKLMPYEVNEIIRNSYKINYKKESQKMISNDMINLMSNMKLNVLKESVNNDLKEVETCISNGAYKASIILCGSILEAVLLDWMAEYENIDDISYVAKVVNKGRIEDLELNGIIKWLEKRAKPHWYEAKKAYKIKNMRNMVHPKVYIRNKMNVTDKECKEVLEDLQDIMESREKRYSI